METVKTQPDEKNPLETIKEAIKILTPDFQKGILEKLEKFEAIPNATIEDMLNTLDEEERKAIVYILSHPKGIHNNALPEFRWFEKMGK